MDFPKRRELEQFNEPCGIPFLAALSNSLTSLERILVKYLFKMDFETTYRHLLAALAYTRSVSKATVIETLFILRRWHEINAFFALDLSKMKDCYIVAQFTNIPIERYVWCNLMVGYCNLRVYLTD